MSSGPDHDIQSDFKRLDKPSCQKILFQIEGSGVFGGIERGGFTAALLGGVHYNLFSDGEVQQFTTAANNSDLFRPIRSACQRLGPRVLWAVYDTLLSTRDRPGAVQHASIASKLLDCVQSLARSEARPTIATYTVSTHQRDRFQSEMAEQDHGLPKSDQNRVISKHGYTQSGEDEQSHYSRYQFESAWTTADTGGGHETLSFGDVPSMTPGRGTHEHSGTMVNTTLSLVNQGPEGNKQNESDMSSFDWNWKEYVAMFTDYLVDGMNREEYQTLANEILASRPSSNKRSTVKEQIRMAVLQKDISLYQMGRFLLTRQQLFPYIFKITEFTNAPITARVKEILKDHLGLFWEQLALRMGKTRFQIDELKHEIPDISSQIDNFLSEKLQFPRFPTMEQTASLLVEIMEKASLPEVAKDVRRAFLSTFRLKEDDVYLGRSDAYQPVDLQLVMQGVDKCEDTSSGLPGESDPQSKPPSPPKTTTGSEDSEGISPSDDDLIFVKEYQEALEKHAYVSIEVIRSLLVGPSGVGKSSLRHLLVHGKSKEITMSTPVMETPDVLVIGEHYTVDDESSIWKQVTEDCLRDSVKQCTRERGYEESSHYPSIIGSSSSDVQAKNIVSHQDSRSDGHSVSNAPSTTQSTAAIDRLQTRPKEVDHLEAAREAVLRSSSIPDYQILLQNTKFIHLIDSGGQPAFQDILPLLLAIPCVYLQIFDASKGFHERIRSTYRPESGSEQQLPSAYLAETHWEFIQRTLSSMQTMAYKFKCRDLQTFRHTPPEFRVIFVGTFKDKIEDTCRVKASIQTNLEELQMKPYFDNVHFAENEQFFLVDNHMTLHSSQADQETGSHYLNKLRECISDARYALKVDVPLMWFMVQIITRSSDKKFIQEAELKEFCLKHEYIDQDRADKQFPCLLKLFHFLGFFAYYDLDQKYLKNGINYVCTDATSFYKEVSKLLAVQYSSPQSGATQKDRFNGLIRNPYNILFELKISPNVDPIWFLEVLNHLGIAARLDSKILHTPPSYFIPSCLPYRNAQVPNNCSVGPLCLTYMFEDGFTTHCDLPRSVFCRLVVELINKKGWKVIIQGSDHTLIKFSIDKTFVFLMEEPGHLRCELAICEHFFPEHLVDNKHLQSLHQCCSTLHGTLLSTLKLITREIFGEEFQNSAQIHPVLPCVCKGNIQYTAKMTDYNDCLATCFHCGVPQRLSPRQKVWFAPLKSSEARVLLQNGVPFWNLEEVKCVPRITCGTSMIPVPSKDIDGDTQNSLNRQSIFQDTSQVIPTRDASTLCATIEQSMLQGVWSEPDSSLGQPSMRTADVTNLFEQFKGEFLNKGKVPAKSITQKLYNDGVIPQDIHRQIEHASDDYNAASILYNHMKTQADGEAAEKLFKIMIHNAGYHQMNDLGRKMMDCLSKTTVPRGVLVGDTLSGDISQNTLALQFGRQPKRSSSDAGTSTVDALSTSNTVSQSSINDNTPSDFGIKKILLHIPKWWDLAGRLGVPTDQVEDLRGDPIMGGDHSRTAPSLGDQGPEGNEQDESDTCSLDWNSKEYVYPRRSDAYQPIDSQSVMLGWDECGDTSSGFPGGSDPQSNPPSPLKTTRDKTPDAPGSSLTAQNNPPIAKSLQTAHGKVKSTPVDPIIAKSDSDSDVPPARSEIPSVTPQPPGEHTGQIATSVLVPPSADNLPQTSKEDSNMIMETEVEDIEACEDDKSEEELLSLLVDMAQYMSPVRGRDKKQIVHFAAELGYVQLLRQMFAAGHNGRAVMERGMTPFLLACEAGKVDIVKLLYQQYGDVILSERDDCGRTCLHFPEVYRKKDLFQYLVWETSADANATSETGVTPLSVACLAGDVQEVNELLVKISPPEQPRTSRMPPLHCAALSSNYAVLKYLIEEDYPYISDSDSKSLDGYTPLHIAAARGNMDIVEYLVGVASCSVNATSADGSTALLLAAMCNHAEIAQYLIDKGAGLDYSREIRKGLYHITPLGEAVLGRNLDVAIVLIQAGADIFFKSGGTTSILDHACIGGNEQIVQMLIVKLLESYPFQAGNVDMFRSAFQVSVDFNDFKIAKLIVETVKRELDVSTVEKVFKTFKGQSGWVLNYPLTKAINQYKQMIQDFPPEDLPNEGDTCRRVAGGRNTVLYHIGYDDGPHWGTELMHVSLLFEDLRKNERFRTAYKRVYMEATKCVINNVVTFNESSWESLASEAQSSGNPSAVQFYSNPKLRSRYADPEVFIHLGHAGRPSAINIACSMVSQNMIQDGFGMHGLTADQYFAEVIKRDKEHPGTFGLKYRCPESEPAGGGSTVQSGRQQSYTSQLPTAPRVTSSPSWKSWSGGYLPVDGEQQFESSSSVEQQLQPSDQQVQPPSSSDQQVQSPSSSDQQLQSPSSSDQQVQSPSSSDQQLQPPSSSDQQVQPPSSSDQQVQPLSSGDQQVQPPSSSDQQAQLPSSGHKQLRPSPEGGQ